MRSIRASGSGPIRPWQVALCACIGVLPVLPIWIKGSPILNNDMLVAYFCYFWDFHKNWSWSHPLVFWSSSYQCGMPMHAYWQSGYLYPVTWILFGPLSPFIGIYLFYAFHFALGIFGFLKLGPHLRLARPASLWAGICFALSGTILARYEHATFLAGWAWLPAVLAAFFALRDRPGLGTLLWYASAVCLQALGGHPQASIVSALLIAAFTVTSLLPRSPDTGVVAAFEAGDAPRDPKEAPSPDKTFSLPSRAFWLAGGHLLALLYCAPLVLPFLTLVDQTDRYDGTAWEDGKASQVTAAEKLEEGVFSFAKFSTGGLRPLHLLSLFAPHALGTPSHASWWGGEAWGEVFLYLGALGLFFCFRASWRRAAFDMRVLWVIGLACLWLAAGAHLGASQILYHLPILNNFRRPARFVILSVMALAALSGHGFQRWTAHDHRSPRPVRPYWIGSALCLAGAGLFFALRSQGVTAQLLALVQHLKRLDPGKDYAGKIHTLLGDGSADLFFLGLSAAALGLAARGRRPKNAAARSGLAKALPWRFLLLFTVLLTDLLRLHWDHFYPFPAAFYRTPPASTAILDRTTQPFWRVSHYLEYSGLEMWNMHNDPLAHPELFEREKNALSCGIHAEFGYRHVSAHLPLLWKWDPATTPARKGTRYLFANRDLKAYRGDSLRALGIFGEVRAYELKDWRPRIDLLRKPETAPDTEAPMALAQPSFVPSGAITPQAVIAPAPGCDPGYSGWADLCVREIRDGEISVRGAFAPGDTVKIRERFQPEWRYRIDGGLWITPLETPDHFLALPIVEASSSVDLTYAPSGFYRLVGLCLLITAVLLVAIPLLPRRDSSP